MVGTSRSANTVRLRGTNGVRMISLAALRNTSQKLLKTLVSGCQFDEEGTILNVPRRLFEGQVEAAWDLVKQLLGCRDISV